MPTATVPQPRTWRRLSRLGDVGPQTTAVLAAVRPRTDCFAGTSRSGSDGTRTRDLRRDRARPWWRPQPTEGTNRLEPRHVAGGLRADRRGSSGALARTFGPGLGQRIHGLKAGSARRRPRRVAASPARRCCLRGPSRRLPLVCRPAFRRRDRGMVQRTLFGVRVDAARRSSSGGRSRLGRPLRGRRGRVSLTPVGLGRSRGRSSPG